MDGAITGKKRSRGQVDVGASPSGDLDEISTEEVLCGDAAASRRSARLANVRNRQPDTLPASTGTESLGTPEKATATSDESAGSGEEGDPPKSAQGSGDEGGQDEDEVHEIPVSSMVIAAKSLVLRAMMLSEMREAQKDAPIVLMVADKAGEHFRCLWHQVDDAHFRGSQLRLVKVLGRSLTQRA